MIEDWLERHGIMFFSLLGLGIIFLILGIDYIYGDTDHRITSYSLAFAVVLCLVLALVYGQKDMKEQKKQNKKEREEYEND